MMARPRAGGASLSSVRQMVSRALARRHAPTESVTRTGAELDRIARDIHKAIPLLDAHAEKAHAMHRHEYAHRVVAHADRLFVDAEFLRTDDPKLCALCDNPIASIEHAVARSVPDGSGARELVHGFGVGCAVRLRHLAELVHDSHPASRDGDMHCAMCKMIGHADVGALPNGWRHTMNGGALCVRCSEVV